MNELEKYYNKFNEEKRLNSRHGRVEFSVAIKYIEKVVGGRKNLKIADIGAGTGKYSAYLADMEHEVVAVEPVKKNLSQIKEKNENIKCILGYADKIKMPDEYFDITLLFGPMYHLISHEDKIKAINEAKRITKKNGYIFIMYLTNEYAFITYAIKEGNLRKCINDGNLSSSDFSIISDKDGLYSYVRLDEINRIKQESGLSRRKIIAVDGATDYIRPYINKLSEEDFKVYIDYIMSIAERPELLGASSHILDVLKKD